MSLHALSGSFCTRKLQAQRYYLIDLRRYDSVAFAAAYPVMSLTTVYGVANLGGIRAIIVSAMVLSSAVGPGLSGVLIDGGISLPTQMLSLSRWYVVACFVLAFAARRVWLREPRNDCATAISPPRFVT